MPKKKRNYRLWTRSEIMVLQKGIQPEGRSYHACVLFCRRNCIPLPGKEMFQLNADLLEKYKGK